MSAEFPTDAERDALYGHEPIDASTQDTYGNETELVGCICGGWFWDANDEECINRWWDHALDTLAPFVADREAAAWDAGADVAWQRSTPEVNGLHYHWRTSGEPLNPYQQEADDDRN